MRKIAALVLAAVSIAAVVVVLNRGLPAIVASTGGGTVTSQPGGINCSVPPGAGNCTKGYDQGQQVTLTVTANAGTLFARWSGTCSGASPCVVQMDADEPVTANFSLVAGLAGLFIEPLDAEQTDQFTQAGLGEIFEVNIIAKPDRHGVRGIQAFINFDPAKLEVQDADSTRPGVQIRDGGVLTDFLPVNRVTIVDGVGHIDYAAGNLRPAGFPSSEFVLATIQFRALEVTGEEPTALDFSVAPITRKTTVSGAVGMDITGDLHGGAVEVIPAVNNRVEPADCPAPVEEALAPLGENLVRIWHIDNSTKDWSVYDPRVLVLRDLTELVEGGIYWLLVNQSQTVTLCGEEISFSKGWTQFAY